MSFPYRISFVCTGNICRSPMGEAVLRHLLDEVGLGDAVAVGSYGTGGWHAGDPADPRTTAALRRRGYDLAHRARQWQAENFASSDLVIALDSGHLRHLQAMAPSAQDAAKVRLLRSFDPAADGGDPEVLDRLDVPDPYYGGAAAFDHVLDLTESSCRGLVREIQSLVSTREG